MTTLPTGWKKNEQALLLAIKCEDFTHAVALFNYIADIANKHNHHPDICLKKYNEIIVTTSTHSEDKVTEKDYALAKDITDLLEYQANKQDIEVNGRNINERTK